MKIKDILQGYKPVEPQMVGVMWQIPIVTDKPYDPVGNVGDLSLERDVGYERLSFKNESQHITVIPHGFMYLKQKGAQDRVVGSAHIIDKTLEVDADCLEPSEGGHMGSGQKDWSILPLGLKLTAWEKHGDGKYDSLWPSIKVYLKNAGLEGQALLKFFDSYKKELDEFIAQFEPVMNQVGAIIMFGDRVVGIEVMPNYTFWKEMWRPIIRDCYGADATVLIKKGLGLGYKPVLDIESIKNIGDLEVEVKKTQNKAKTFAEQAIDHVLGQEVASRTKENIGDWSMLDIESDEYKGQIVRHGPEHMIYMSTVFKKLNNPETFKRQFAPIWDKKEVYGKSEFKF